MALSNGAIIVIVIVCCGAFVCCLAAMGLFYRRREHNEPAYINHGWRPTNDQNDYMREIRSKNQKGMFHVARYHERALSSQASRSTFSSPSRSEAISPV
ncbi:hypothetical protein KCU65_g4687, partial [Aureobasidium melanogenum]